MRDNGGGLRTPEPRTLTNGVGIANTRARLAQLYALLDEVIALEGGVDEPVDEEAA